MARLFLIRHAPTSETGRILTGRKPGVDLSDEGETMARALAQALSSTRFEAIYSSLVDRAWQTAQIVAAPHRLAPIPDENFLENDYGRWAGRSLSSLNKLKAWRQVVTSPARVRFPEGESMAEMQARAIAGCEDLASRHRGTVAVISHADVIKAALGHYLGAPLDLLERIEVGPASVSIIDLAPGRPGRVMVINQLPSDRSWR